MRVMIVVTHLLGTGHLARAATLGRAFAAAGHNVHLVSGGMPVPRIDTAALTLHQLPPLRSDGTDFTRLLTPDGPADPACLQARRTALLDAFGEVRPDVVITELYPFGRRILAPEFDALLDAAHARADPPLILASLRDILAPPSKPSKAARTDAVIAARYDGVLVHADPRATALDISWPVSPALAPRLIYTGYVTPPAPDAHPDGTGSGEVLVSTGGSAVAPQVFDAALQAAAGDPDRRWRLLVGGGDAALLARLQAAAAGTPTLVEPVRPDYRQMLAQAAASVSLCGYNTALDILQTGTPAVFVPFDAGQEVEQGLRAQSLSGLPAIEVIRTADLTAAELAQAVARVARAGRRPDLGLRFDGGPETVRIVETMGKAG